MRATESQNIAILKWMQAGNSITSLEALNMFGCMRLASRIHDIKKMYNVKSVTVTRNGRRFSQYYMEA